MPALVALRQPEVPESSERHLPTPLCRPAGEPPQPPDTQTPSVHAVEDHGEPSQKHDITSAGLLEIEPSSSPQEAGHTLGASMSTMSPAPAGSWLEELRAELLKQEKRLEWMLRLHEGRIVRGLESCRKSATGGGGGEGGGGETLGMSQRLSGQQPKSLSLCQQQQLPSQTAIGDTAQQQSLRILSKISLAEDKPSPPVAAGPVSAWSSQRDPVKLSITERQRGSQASSFFATTWDSETVHPEPEKKTSYRATRKDMLALVRNQEDGYNEAILKMQKGENVMDRRSVGESEEALPESPACASCHNIARQLLESRRFELFVTCIIIVNAVFVGVQTDWAIQHVDRELPLSIRIFNLVFTVLFAFEISLRLFVERAKFWSFSNRHWGWNILDLLIVLTAVGEEVLNYLAIDAGNLSVLRMLRVLRLARFVRFFRVMRFFRDLRVMLHGILGSMKALMWCIMLLILVMYMFAVLVIQVVKLELEELHDTRQNENFAANTWAAVRQKELEDNFGSMLLCLFSLFKCVLGGVDWGEQADLLKDIHPIWLVPFTLYISFAILCVLNVVTGVFVENANKLTMQDQDHVIMEELEKRKAWFEEVRSIFKHADMDGSGTVDFAEFESILGDERVKAIFRRVGIDVETISPRGLFELFVDDDSAALSIDEFVVCVQQFHGGARALDVAKVLHILRQQRKQDAGETSAIRALCERSWRMQIDLEERIAQIVIMMEPMAKCCRRSGSRAFEDMATETMNFADIEPVAV